MSAADPWQTDVRIRQEPSAGGTGRAARTRGRDGHLVPLPGTESAIVRSPLTVAPVVKLAV